MSNKNDVPYLNIPYHLLTDTKHTQNYKRPDRPGNNVDIINLYSTLEEGYTQGYWTALTSGTITVQGTEYEAGTALESILEGVSSGIAGNLYTQDGNIDEVRAVTVKGSLNFEGDGDMTIDPEVTFSSDVEIDSSTLIVSNGNFEVSNGNTVMTSSTHTYKTNSSLSWLANTSYNAPVDVTVHGIISDLDAYTYSQGHVLPTANAVKDYIQDEVGNVSTSNIYTSNGSLPENRFVNLTGHSLIFNGTTGSATVTDAGVIVSSSLDTGFQTIMSPTSRRHMRLTDGTDVVDIHTNPGTPETFVTADKGSLTLDSSNGELYIKKTDATATGWVKFMDSESLIMPALHSPSLLMYRNTSELDWGWGNDTDAINNAVAYKAGGFLNGYKMLFPTGTGSNLYATKYELANFVGMTTVIDAPSTSKYYNDSINGGTQNQGIIESYAISKLSSRFFKRVVEQTANPVDYVEVIQTSNKQYLRGTRNPLPVDTSAIFEIDSTTQGTLLSRMTTTQINAVVSPSEGLIIYNTTLHQLCFYNGTEWRKISDTTM